MHNPTRRHDGKLRKTLVQKGVRAEKQSISPKNGGPAGEMLPQNDKQGVGGTERIASSQASAKPAARGETHYSGMLADGGAVQMNGSLGEVRRRERSVHQDGRALDNATQINGSIVGAEMFAAVMMRWLK